MQQEPTDEQAGKRKIWLIILCSSLLLLSILWSIDTSIVYFLTGLAAFSLYKVLENTTRKATADEPPYDRSFQQAYSVKPSFWDQVKDLFHQASYNPRKRSQLISFMISGFVGLIFFIVILTAIFSDDPSATANDARQQAGDYYDRQIYDTAAYYYGIAINNDPENAELYLDRGNAFLNGNKADSAMLDYDKALSLRPEYREAYYNKGLIYYNRKQYRNSINQLKESVKVSPEYTDAMVLIGDSFYNSSQLDSAMVWYEDAYSKGYRSAGLSHIMAYIYDTKGNTGNAITFYKEAISYDTTRTEIYTRLGELVGGEEGNLYRQKAARYQLQ